jgi:hypothetical protein
MLNSRVDRLNVVLNRPLSGWTRKDGKLTANIGHFHLDTYGPGDGWTRYTLAVMCSDGGGQSNASPTCTAQEMWAYLRGVFDVLDSEYTHVFDKPNTPVEELAMAVIKWAKTPGSHGGNPYTLEFVQLAEKLIEKAGAN